MNYDDPKKEKIRLVSLHLLSAKMQLKYAKEVLRNNLKRRYLDEETRLWYQELMMSMYTATKELQAEYNTLKGVLI